MDNLHKILATVERIIKNKNSGLSEDGAGPIKFNDIEREDSMRLWNGRRSRILILIVNCALIMKKFSLAIEVLEDLYKLSWNKEQLEILRSAIGRVQLFLGDVAAAEKKFVANKDDPKSSLGIRELVDRGLMTVAQNAFQEAFNCFKTASVLDPSNVMLINNMAVCLLYFTGERKTAVQLLEKAVARNPIKSLQESVLSNMSSLYELPTTHCKESKLHLLRQLNRYKRDAIDIQYLQLPM